MSGFRVCSKRGLVGKTTSKRHEHTGINIDVKRHVCLREKGNQSEKDLQGISNKSAII